MRYYVREHSGADCRHATSSVGDYRSQSVDSTVAEAARALPCVVSQTVSARRDDDHRRNMLVTDAAVSGSREQAGMNDITRLVSLLCVHSRILSRSSAKIGLAVCCVVQRSVSS